MSPSEIASPSGPMVPICDGVYAEPTTSAEERQGLRRAYDSAARTVAQALGPWHKEGLLVLFCRSPECKIAFIGPTPAATATDVGWTRMNGVLGVYASPTVVVTGPAPTAENVLAHEMVHYRMGSVVPYDSLPTWFNEGAAAMISGAPPCSNVTRDAIDDLRLLDTKQGWQDHIRQPELIVPTYCQSLRAVQAWSQCRAGQRCEPVLALVHAVAAGASFDAAFKKEQR